MLCIFLSCVTIRRRFLLRCRPIETGGGFMHYSTHLYSQADHYRRRAIEARQRAVQTPGLFSAKAAFEEVAYHWVALAEQVEWLERWRMAEDFTSGPPVFPPARSCSSS